MENVLIPVDGSECSLRGVAWAIEKRAFYSSPDDLDIHLVNVQVPFSNDITRFVSHDQTEGFHRDESEKHLRSACQLLDAAGVKYSTHCLVGKVAETISGLADSLRCDQIVMGTHGRGALAELLLGSVTIRVMHLAKTPVLVVK